MNIFERWIIYISHELGTSVYIFAKKYFWAFEHNVIVFAKIVFWAFINSCQNRFGFCKISVKLVFGLCKTSAKLVFEFCKIVPK